MIMPVYKLNNGVVNKTMGDVRMGTSTTYYGLCYGNGKYKKFVLATHSWKTSGASIGFIVSRLDSPIQVMINEYNMSVIKSQKVHKVCVHKSLLKKKLIMK